MHVLVLAPHPDDAALACAGLLQQADAATVCHVTAGDGYYRAAAAYSGHVPPAAADFLALGRRRLAEGRRAAALLGVGDVVDLGFPDGALPAVLSALAPVTSPYTGAAAVPYPGTLDPGAPYTRATLLALLAAVVDGARYDLVAYPAATDGNADHRAVARAASWVLRGRAVRRFRYLVHHDLYPGLGLDWNRVLDPPWGALPGPRCWVGLDLGQERRKRAAITAHTSQMLVLREWLLAFVGVDEPFREEGGP